MKLKATSPHFQALYGLVRDRATYDALVRIEPPRSIRDLVVPVLRNLAWDRSLDRPTDTWFLSQLLESGGRIDRLDDPAPRLLQESLRKATSGGEVVRVLQNPDLVERSIFLRIIASAPLIRRRRELGITRDSLKQLAEHREAPASVRAEARRELRRAAEDRWS